MSPPDINPKRLGEELAADVDLLRSLSENGDVPAIVRPVDVRFVGSAPAIASLEEDIEEMGRTIIQRVQVDGEEEALDVQRR